MLVARFDCRASPRRSVARRGRLHEQMSGGRWGLVQTRMPPTLDDSMRPLSQAGVCRPLPRTRLRNDMHLLFARGCEEPGPES